MIAALVLAASAAIGTWVLDLSKSSFDPGPPVKEQTRVYEETPAGVKFTLTGVSASGRPMRVEFTARADGKDYPMTGSPSSDTIAITRVDRFTIEAVEKKDGRVTFHVRRAILGDTMTVTSDGVNVKGVHIHNVLVFRRR